MHAGWKGGIIYKVSLRIKNTSKEALKKTGEIKKLFVVCSHGTTPKDVRKRMLGQPATRS